MLGSLQDWLVPVLYQQDALHLPVDALQPGLEPQQRLPDEARAFGDYGGWGDAYMDVGK
jgi:hypothetical protein